MGAFEAENEDWLLEAGEAIEAILDHWEELDLPPHLVRLILALDEAITTARTQARSLEVT